MVACGIVKSTPKSITIDSRSLLKIGKVNAFVHVAHGSTPYFRKSICSSLHMKSQLSRSLSAVQVRQPRHHKWFIPFNTINQIKNEIKKANKLKFYQNLEDPSSWDPARHAQTGGLILFPRHFKQFSAVFRQFQHQNKQILQVVKVTSAKVYFGQEQSGNPLRLPLQGVQLPGLFLHQPHLISQGIQFSLALSSQYPFGQLLSEPVRFPLHLFGLHTSALPLHYRHFQLQILHRRVLFSSQYPVLQAQSGKPDLLLPLQTLHVKGDKLHYKHLFYQLRDGRGTYPKAGSPEFHKKLIDIVTNEYKSATLSELLHLAHSFRTTRNVQFMSALFEESLTRLLNPKSVESQAKIPKKVTSLGAPPEAIQADDFANVFFNYQNNRVPKQFRNQFRVEKQIVQVEDEQFLSKILPGLLQNIPQMSLQALVRTTIAFQISRQALYGDVAVRLQSALIPHFENLDSFQSTNIIYCFSQLLDGRGFGSKNFHEGLLKVSNKLWDQQSLLEKSKILYAFSNIHIPHQQLLPFVKENMTKFSYTELHFNSLSLMFNNISDKEIWINFIQNVANQKYVVPRHYYYSLKIARYYMDAFYPQFNYLQYQRACEQAEYYFSTLRMRESFLTQESKNIIKILLEDIKVQVKLLVEWDNLFLIEAAIFPQKVAILVQKPDFDSLSDGVTPSPMFNLKQFILQKNGWKNVVVVYNIFKSKPAELRNQELKSEIEAAFKQQSEIYDSKEEERYNKVLNDMITVGQTTAIGGHEMQSVGNSLEFDFSKDTGKQAQAPQQQKQAEKPVTPPSTA